MSTLVVVDVVVVGTDLPQWWWWWWCSVGMGWTKCDPIVPLWIESMTVVTVNWYADVSVGVDNRL